MLTTTRCVPDEQQGPTDGELGVVVVRVPRVGPEVVHRRQARPDMEVHRHPERAACVPDGIPLRAREVGRAEILRVGGQVDAAQAEVLGPLHLAHRCVDVPRREQRHRQQPVAGAGLDLRARVVEDLEADRPERNVLHDAREALPAEADDTGEHDLGPDADLVHELHTRDRVVGRDMGPVDLPLVQAVERAALVAVIVDDPSRTGPAEDRAVDAPTGHPVEARDLRHAIPQRRRCPARPQVVLFGHVRVGVDDLDLGERERHAVSLCPSCAAGSRGSRRRGPDRASGSSPPWRG